jgi:hypothetical protein
MDPREANSPQTDIRQQFMYVCSLRKARIEQWAPADEGSQPDTYPSFWTFGNKSNLNRKKMCTILIRVLRNLILFLKRMFLLS